MAENNSEIDFEIDIDNDQIWTELSSALDNLSDEIPQQPNINIPQKSISYQEEIDDINAKAESAMVDSRAKLINLYIDCEKERLNQQKPLLESVIKLTKTLIWLFNIVIGLITVAVIILCFVQSDTSILQNLFDFLKYYVGAVVIELIGMLIFIVKGVFSTNYNKIMESVLGFDSSKDQT